MFEELNRHRWCLDSVGYPSSHLRGKKGEKFRMHRIVNGTPPRVHTDHKNGFKIDNTRRNLRSCSYSKNMQNQRVQQRAKTSQFKGVSFVKITGKWMAYVGSKKNRIYLGSTFPTERDAAAAYNKAALERYGEYALLNEI